MLTIEEVRRRLSDRNIAEVARRIEAGYAQVYGIYTGIVTHPSFEVIAALSAYFEGEHQKVEGE